MLLVIVVQALLVGLLLDDMHVNVCDSRVTIENTGDLLKGGSLSLRVDEVNPNELDGDPALYSC